MVEVSEVDVSNCETLWSQSYRLMVPSVMVYKHQDGAAVCMTQYENGFASAAQIP
jgi:hypothetical protein